MTLVNPSDPIALCQDFFNALFITGRLEDAVSFLSENIAWRGDTELFSATGKKNVLHLLSFAITYYRKADQHALFSLNQQVLAEGVAMVDGVISLEISDAEKTDFKVAVICAREHLETRIAAVQFHLQKKVNQNPLDQYLSSLFDIMPCGILFFEYSKNQSQMVYINHFATSLLGYDLEALRGVKGSELSKLISDEDTAAFTQMFNALLSDPAKTQAENDVHMRTRHGERWFHAVCNVLNHTPEICSIVVSIVDITQGIIDHMKSWNIIEHIPTSICTFEVKDGVIWQRYISNNFPEKLGYPTENFSERILSLDFPLVHQDDLENLRKNYNDMLMGADVIDVTFRAKKQNGRYLWCNLIAQRFPENTGTLMYYGTYTDVDDKIQAQHAVTKAKDELERVITSLPGGVAFFQQEQEKIELVFFSTQLCTMLDISREEYIQSITPQRPFGCLCMETSQMDAKACFGMNALEPMTKICKAEKKDGSMLWVRIVYKVITKPSTAYLSIIVTDVSEEIRLKQAELWLSKRYSILSEVTDATIFDYNPQQDSLTYRMCTYQIMTEDTTVMAFTDRMRNSSLIHPDERAAACEKLADAILAPVKSILEMRLDLKGNGYQWFRLHYISLADEEGTVFRLIGRLDDIQAEKEKDLAMIASIQREKLFRRSIVANAFFVQEFNLTTQKPLDSDTNVHPQWLPYDLSFRDTLAFLCGYIIHEEDRTPIFNTFLANGIDGPQKRGTRTVSFDCRVKFSYDTNEYRWSKLMITIAGSQADDQIYGYISLSDIHSQKLRELDTQRLLTVDTLTGLRNRSSFENDVDKFLQRIRLGNPATGNFALVYIDIDDFKSINDYLGHDYGDVVLVQASQTISALKQENDLYCRYGNDEFMLLLTNLPGEDILQERLRVLCLALNRRMNKYISITVSIGCVIQPYGDQGVSLFEKAERALRIQSFHHGGEGKQVAARWHGCEHGPCNSVAHKVRIG